jgi:hypothetical protein
VSHDTDLGVLDASDDGELGGDELLLERQDDSVLDGVGRVDLSTPVSAALEMRERERERERERLTIALTLAPTLNFFSGCLSLMSE